jgi:hypothetical protein
MSEPIKRPLHQGDQVLLLAYGGEHIIRRVWLDHGRGVYICSEDVYQQALASGDDPWCVGWPPEDVLAIVDRADATGDDDADR